MSTTSPTISPAPPANKGEDYAYLKQEGTTFIQQLSHNIWTDYNEHDPGVTTLEQLCYALTELSYRATFPLKDLLLDAGGKIEPHRQALFIARRILPCNPQTRNDYRKVIVDRVPSVANVWLEPCPPEEAGGVDGLYDISLYAPSIDDCSTDDRYNPAAVIDAVRRVYTHHRDLCEDVRTIRFLRQVTVTVFADAIIEDVATPEAILAGILFGLGNFVAPEPRRRSLRSLVDAGTSPDEIFDGPLLLHGFIDDDQLQPKATEIPVRDLTRIMANSVGVASVRNVRVRVDGRERMYGPDDSIPVPDGEILVLRTLPEDATGAFSIRMFKNGREVVPNPGRVRRELDILWADWRRTYELDAQYEEYFGLPQGRYYDLTRYFSIQNQYPNVYGINAFGLPADAPLARRGQAKQLKGYLLVFEQLLADFFSQLARVRELFSIDPALRHTYFYQYLTGSVPNVEPLLKKARPGSGDEGYEAGLRQLVHDQDPFTDRRNRFLDLLLALYGESLDADSVSGWTCDGPDGGPGERLLRAKLALLHHLVESTHSRGRGFDYLEGSSKANTAGLVIKSRIQLGMEAFDERSLVDVLDELSLEVVEAEAGAAGRGTLNRYIDHIEEHFAPAASWAERSVRPAGDADRPLRAQAVTEELLMAAGDLDNFRLGSLPGDSATTVVCKSPPDGEWHLVGRYPDVDSALARIYALVDRVRELSRHFQQLYVVEHVLLRFARPEDRGFAYSFTATVVISVCAPLRRDLEYRRFARQVIRENMPAHVVMDCLFLGPARMGVFERLYWAWRTALRQRKEPRIVETSTALRDFLQRVRQEEERQTGSPDEGA